MKTFHPLLLAIVLLFGFPAAALAQDGEVKPTALTEDKDAAKPVVSSLKGLHGITSTNIMKTAELLGEELYAYRPTEEVRTAGQMLAHVANAQYLFCSVAADEANPSEVNYEETATTKEAIITALKDAFDYCEGIYDGMSDAEGAEMRSLFGREMAASGILAFNSTHNYEHYGNLVTYMRMNGIVPPSSAQ